MLEEGQELIHRDKRTAARIDKVKNVKDTWYSGATTLYLVNGKYLTALEISEQYYTVGIDKMPV